MRHAARRVTAPRVYTFIHLARRPGDWPSSDRSARLPHPLPQLPGRRVTGALPGLVERVDQGGLPPVALAKVGLAAIDGFAEQLEGRMGPVFGVRAEIADDLTADGPEIVHVPAHRFGGKALGDQVVDEGEDLGHQGPADGQVLVGALPALGPPGYQVM